MTQKILITGSRHFVAIPEARYLSSTGAEIYTADSANFDYTMYSSAVKKYFKVPQVRFDEYSYIDSIIKIINDFQIDEVISLGEESYYIARHLDKISKLSPNTMLNIENIESLMTLHNKWLFYNLSTKLNLPVPKTIYTKNPLKLNTKIVSKIEGRCVLKPVFSRFGHLSKEMQSVHDLKYLNIDFLDSNGYVVQEYIKGEPVSSYSLSNNKNVVTYRSAIKMNSPGAMAAAIRLETPEIIREIDTKIREELKYKGQLGLDFILKDNGEYVLLEANPRATVGRILTRQKKIQFRIMMLHQLIGGQVSIGQIPAYVWTMISFPDAIWNFRDLKPALMSQIMSKGLGTYLKFIITHPGLSFQDYSTYDMEFNGFSTDIHNVVSATKDDDERIKFLLEGTKSKGFISLIYARRPSAFKSFTRDNAEIALLNDVNGNIMYMCACAKDKYYINGEPVEMGYITSLRKNPKFNGYVDWKKVFYKYFDMNIYFFSILKNNSRAHTALERVNRSIDEPKLVASYNMKIVNANRIEKPKIQYCEIKNIDDFNLTDILKFINTEGSKKDLFPCVTKNLLNRIGINQKNSIVLVKKDKIVAFAGLVDQRKWKQFILTNYSWTLKLIKPIFNLYARNFKYISIPEIGTPVNSPTVTLFVVKNNNPELEKELLYAVSQETNKRHSDIFTIATITGSSIDRILNTKYNLAIKNDLYMVSKIDKKLGENKLLYIDALMLY